MRRIAFVSVFSAFLYAVAAYFIIFLFDKDIAFPLSVISGSLFYILLFLYMFFHFKRLDKKYKEIEQKISLPIWYRMNCSIQTPNGVRNSNVYFTDGGIVFVSLDKKPYAIEEIAITEIERYESDNSTQLVIYVKDGRTFLIMSGELKELFTVLREHGWI